MEVVNILIGDPVCILVQNSCGIVRNTSFESVSFVKEFRKYNTVVGVWQPKGTKQKQENLLPARQIMFPLNDLE